MSATTPITELERRIIGHLPSWAQDEAAFIAMEGGPEHSIRTFNLPDYTAHLLQDPNVVGVDANGDVRAPVEAEIEQLLDAAVERGLAERDDDGEEARWRLTELGMEALTGPEKAPDQIPGPVTVPVQPAHGELKAKSVGKKRRR